MDKLLKYTGLITICTIGFIIAYKILTTAIWLFFSGMLLLLNNPLQSMAVLTLLTILSFAYIHLNEK